MTRLHTTLLTMASLAGLVLGGCALDGEEPEAASLDDERPLSGPTEQQQPAEEDEGPSEPDQGDDDCTSTLDGFGQVCTTCGDSSPECLVGACSVRDRCMECTNPVGRVAVNCSIDYESLPIESWTAGGGGTFNVCSASWGFPGGASGVCHYPGTESCTITEDGDARCIDCTYPDGSGSGTCLLDPNEPLPDIMAGRPSTLPGPNACVTSTYEGVECSTCTREDLGATMACRMAPAASCEPIDGDDPLETCFVCQLEGGGTATFCDDAGS